MKKITIFTMMVLAIMLIGLSANAQYFNYTSNTTVNTESSHGTVTSPSTYAVSFNNAFNGYCGKEVYKQLNHPLSDDCWSVKFKFTPLTNSDQPADFVLMFTSDTSYINFHNITDAINGTYDNQDFIGVKLYAPSGATGAVGADGNTGGISYWRLGIYTKDGTNAPAPTMNSNNSITLTYIDTDYYVLLERSGTTVTLTVYSDSGYTTAIGSSTTYTITGSITGLDYIQHSVNMENGTSRELNATVQNVEIITDCNCDFWEDYSTSSGWTQAGTKLAVDPSTMPNTAYFDGTLGSTQNTDTRVYKSIYSSGSLDDLSWRARFEFTPINDQCQEPQDIILAFTETTANPTYNTTSTSEDMAGVKIYGPGSTSFGINTWKLGITSKNGTSTLNPVLSSNGSAFTMTTYMTYYLEFSRDNDIFYLKQFPNSTYSGTPTNSVSLNVGSSFPVTNLGYVQSMTNYANGPARHLTATVDNLCIDDNFLGYHSPVSFGLNNTSEESLITNFSIFPNPNNGIMQLNYQLRDSENGLIKIYDLLGKEKVTMKLVHERNSMNIYDENMISGIYFYKVIIDGKVVKSDKLIVTK